MPIARVAAELRPGGRSDTTQPASFAAGSTFNDMLIQRSQVGHPPNGPLLPYPNQGFAEPARYGEKRGGARDRDGGADVGHGQNRTATVWR